MARVSQKPGKTRLLQFFDLGSKAYLVDLPGYGYATGNRREAESWKYLIENYLSSRTNLKGTLLVMDIRRPWAQEEQDLVGWLDHHKIRWAVLLSKADKLSRSQMLKRIAELKSLIGTPPVLPVSMLKRTGMEDVKKLVLEEWMP